MRIKWHRSLPVPARDPGPGDRETWEAAAGNGTADQRGTTARTDGTDGTAGRRCETSTRSAGGRYETSTRSAGTADHDPADDWVGDHADAHEAAEISAEHPVAESSGWSLTHRWDRSPIR